jgi:hypothetical protein
VTAEDDSCVDVLSSPSIDPLIELSSSIAPSLSVMAPLLPVALLGLAALVQADGIYSKSSPVLQVTAKTYDSLIAQSNHTSVRRSCHLKKIPC